MKTNKKCFLIPLLGVRGLLLIFLFCTACKKTGVDALPPETQIGANTFGCLVDGKA
jgi:hypothetical protein